MYQNVELLSGNCSFRWVSY